MKIFYNVRHLLKSIVHSVVRRHACSRGLACGFGAVGQVGAVHGDAEQCVGARAVLVHLGSKGDSVPTGFGQDLENHQRKCIGLLT